MRVCCRGRVVNVSAATLNATTSVLLQDVSALSTDTDEGSTELIPLPMHWQVLESWLDGPECALQYSACHLVEIVQV